jgi:hypothetical protein
MNFQQSGVVLKNIIPASKGTAKKGVYSQSIYIASPINNRKERVRRMLGPESNRGSISNTNSVKNAKGGKRRAMKKTRKVRKGHK